MRNLNSLTVPKKREVSECRKKWKGPFCFGMAFYLMLEVLDALKMKYNPSWDCWNFLHAAGLHAG